MTTTNKQHDSKLSLRTSLIHDFMAVSFSVKLAVFREKRKTANFTESKFHGISRSARENAHFVKFCEILDFL